MLYFITGPDRTRALRFLEGEISRLLSEEPGTVVVDIRPDGHERDIALIPALRPLLVNHALFPERRIIIVRDYLKLLSPREKTELLELLSRVKRAGAPDFFLMFLERDAQSLGSLPSSLGAKLYSFSFLTRSALTSWIQKEAERLGARCERKAAARLADVFGPETAALAPVMLKLVAASGRGRVTLQDLRNIYRDEEGEESVFPLLEALERADLKRALSHYGTLKERFPDSSYLLAMLSYSLRSRIGRRDRTPRPKSRVRTIFELQQLLRSLHDVDVLWKSGKADPEYLLERYFIRFSTSAA